MELMKKILMMALMLLPILGCGTTVTPTASDPTLKAVDQRVLVMNENAKTHQLEQILTIDHSRLAGKAGEYLNASRVDFYSDDALNTSLLTINPQVGLDLPFRVLNYAEGNTIHTIYTDAQFIQKRHGIRDESILVSYNQHINELVDGLDNTKPVNSEGVTEGYGIETLVSEYDFDMTLTKIKKEVLNQDDTVWFMNLDYKKRAEAIGKTLPNTTLLVFGGPAPGAKAMVDFPSIGLDAFGQKVLVIEQDGQVLVKYNNIVDFAELHYGDNAIAHKVINYRLSKTLSRAIEK